MIEYMRELGFTSTEAAYWLGHTEQTNETNYLALSEKQRITREKVFKKAKEKLGFGKPVLKVVGD